MKKVSYRKILNTHKTIYDELAQEYEVLVATRLTGNLDRIQLFTQFIPKRATVLI